MTPDPWREALDAAAEWVESDASDSIAAWGTNDPRSEYAEYVAGNIRAIRRPAASAWRELEAKLSRSGYEDEREGGPGTHPGWDNPGDAMAVEAMRRGAVLQGEVDRLQAFISAQRPSPEGLHAQKGREVGHIALNLETGEDLSSPPLVYRHWDPKRMVKKAPLRCRLGWHDWFGDGRLRTCTRCHKEKP